MAASREPFHYSSFVVVLISLIKDAVSDIAHADFATTGVHSTSFQYAEHMPQ